MFDMLSRKISSLMARVTGNNALTESNIGDAVSLVRDALIDADVPYRLVDEFIQTIKKEVVGKKVIKSLQPGEQFIKIVHDRVAQFLGGTHSPYTFRTPSVIMVLGLQGAGKTSTIAKIVYHFNKQAQEKNKKRKILVGSVDFTRPAAIEQLRIGATNAGALFYQTSQSSCPIQACQELYTHYKQDRFDHLIIDTAGRLHVDNTLLQELRTIDTQIRPDAKLLVLDSMTGQESLAVAQAFEQVVGFDGAIMTKVDSDVRGGALFSFRYALKKPIVFITYGEKQEDISLFRAERIASRMLGMGDVQDLLERAQEKIKDNQHESLYQSIMTEGLTLSNFSVQIDMVKKLGSLRSIMKYLPGAAQVSLGDADYERGEKEMVIFKALISSMTAYERNNPRIIDGSRAQRIEKGAGVATGSVKVLLERFDQAQQYVKMLKMH